MEYVEDADTLETDLIINAVTRRYNRHYPDHDIAFLSLPRDPGKRKQQLEWMLQQIKAGTIL